METTTTDKKARTKQCRHCETAIEQKPGHVPVVWIHSWSQSQHCLRVLNKKPLGTIAAPRPEK